MINAHCTPWTADALLAVLVGEDALVRQNALQRLYLIVDQCWSEISDAIPLIEELSEDETFQSHELAAAVASKIFFHLEEYDDALRLALGAGNYFDVDARTEYVEMLISKCMDTYIKTYNSPVDAQQIILDPRLANVIERMFQRCYADGEFFHAMGIALEAHRLDKIEEVVKRCPSANRHALFSYVLEVIPSVTTTCAFRRLVVRTLVMLHPLLEKPDYIFLCHALQYLDASDEIRILMIQLIQGNNYNELLLGYQLAFMIVESENQKFIFDVVTKLREPPDSVVLDEVQQKHITNLVQIMDIEGLACKIHLDFSQTKSQTDLLIFKAIKDSIDGNRNSVLHNATVIAHSYANAGTTDTSFLRNNLEWMGKASNWAKFIATSSIGVIHKGHVKDSIRILQPYLPQSPISGSPFSEGGALYALGLVHAGKAKAGTSIAITYLVDALHNSGNSEPLQHGACLGLGLAAMSTGREEYYEELKTVLYFDSAVAGEAAAYGIGLILLGHGDESSLSRNAISELFAYAHETSHEKIIRGVALAISLIVLGKEKAAEPTIELLCRDRDAIIRYGGMHAIGLAYAGTANNHAVKRLLHVAVSDVCDDVRRAAVTCLGLVLFRTPKKILALVGLLLESFNPHVRFGACMAIGFSHPASGDSDAISLLQPLLIDAIDFVRQGAFMATALVLMQQSNGRVQSLATFRQKIADLVKDKYPSTLTKIGAIMAAGILDAGGRNSAIVLQSSGGFLKSSACAGLVLWAQSWYWYPMFHFFSLALTPTMLVGLNSDFEMPKRFSLICSAPPEFFAYPPRTREKKEAKKERVATVILSTTLKHKVREKAKDQEKISPSTSKHLPEEDLATSEKDSPQLESAEAALVKISYFELSNPSRLTQTQMQSCKFDIKQRYIPVARKIKPSGIIILADREPSEPQDVTRFHELSNYVGSIGELEQPGPFEWPC
jgi:26S proteasome regulatory subunit N2